MACLWGESVSHWISNKMSVAPIMTSFLYYTTDEGQMETQEEGKYLFRLFVPYAYISSFLVYTCLCVCVSLSLAACFHSKMRAIHPSQRTHADKPLLALSRSYVYLCISWIWIKKSFPPAGKALFILFLLTGWLTHRFRFRFRLLR